MKSYKEFNKISLGSSDIAMITVRCGKNLVNLDFGMDGRYSAYFAPERCEVGAHYKRVAHFDIKESPAATEWNGNAPWLWVFDDEGRVFEYQDDNATEINIYQAGEMGCIIEFCQD